MFEESTEAALNPDDLARVAEGIFETQQPINRGGEAYFVILNSLVLRVPLRAKAILAPPLFILERAFNRLPGRFLFAYFIPWWRWLSTPVTKSGATSD